MFRLKNRIEKLEEQNLILSSGLTKLRDRCEDLNKENDKLYRLLRHHGNGSSYELKHTYSWISLSNNAPELYMYINDEEYIIELSELQNINVDRSSINFGVCEHNDKFVYFNIKHASDTITFYFTIDYKKGTYLYHSEKIKEESEDV